MVNCLICVLNRLWRNGDGGSHGHHRISEGEPLHHVLDSTEPTGKLASAGCSVFPLHLKRVERGGVISGAQAPGSKYTTNIPAVGGPQGLDGDKALLVKSFMQKMIKYIIKANHNKKMSFWF